MGKQTILIVEDEEDIQELVRYHLVREGYQVLRADTGEEGLAQAESQLPDLLILDLMLPGLNGLEVCKRLKNQAATQDIPIIILSAKGEEADIVTGLELGADDYVTKPFGPKELIARVKAVLRRMEAPGEQAHVVRLHNIVIDPDRYEVTVSGEKRDLTVTEFGILYALARHPGRVFTRSQLVDAVHGDNYVVSDRAVDVQITGLRRKMGHSGKYIETVRGVGYRMRDRS
ncbi:MAG: response regulator transcription factor [Sedimentisphaerales bacterium]|nr:response regulator transcription factor [Sedimentisphaerales bacterium]